MINKLWSGFGVRILYWLIENTAKFKIHNAKIMLWVLIIHFLMYIFVKLISFEGIFQLFCRFLIMYEGILHLCMAYH